ncbi:3-dehydroquinate synthase [Peptoniphilus asaccharolyticus]
MEKVTVSTSSKYEILIEKGLRKKVKDLLPKKDDCKYILLTDENVDRLYGAEMSAELSEYKVIKYVLKPGENSKSFEELQKFLEFMAREDVNASDILIAFGGGVVGDFGGFAAGIYRRGIEYIQLPTTLLSQVDSSVGGKTAVNLSEGKNMVGLFKQPLAVYCDPDFFKTLEDQDFSSGVGEVIKYGVLFDRELFEVLSHGIDKNQDLSQIVKKCVELKRDIVEADEYDNGKRQLLNLGHTLAHAIEIKAEYGITHGRTVAIGTMVMVRACKEEGIFIGEVQQVENCMQRNNLPTSTEFSVGELFELIERDKKRRGSYINEILIEEIGKCRLQKFDFTGLRQLIEKGIK